MTTTKRYAVRFMDAFSFATVTKSVDYTPSQAEAMQQLIKAGQVVHSHTSNNIRWNWIPIKMYDPASPEGRAEQVIATVNTNPLAN